MGHSLDREFVEHFQYRYHVDPRWLEKFFVQFTRYPRNFIVDAVVLYIEEKLSDKGVPVAVKAVGRKTVDLYKAKVSKIEE